MTVYSNKVIINRFFNFILLNVGSAVSGNRHRVPLALHNPSKDYCCVYASFTVKSGTDQIYHHWIYSLYWLDRPDHRGICTLYWLDCLDHRLICTLYWLDWMDHRGICTLYWLGLTQSPWDLRSLIAGSTRPPSKDLCIVIITAQDRMLFSMTLLFYTYCKIVNSE